ncbi:hypothetical protein SAMN04487897_12463 [Paenibacillus sp. yr247]|uniref:hypothetical protein n=1 Tax=Paenibacillus sp. yr247 TaxID=1761880 RepID=UPI000885BC32|nr:hypothetical protein [Paenibacillus sp. yr247]SDO85396.1 hypothetical protein SAMN04487897_12463 [Paenibacillus sp. yr247]
MPVYDAVARLRKPLEHIADLLEPDTDKTSETVRWEMTALLEWMKLTYTKADDVLMVDNVLRTVHKRFLERPVYLLRRILPSADELDALI